VDTANSDPTCNLDVQITVQGLMLSEKPLTISMIRTAVIRDLQCAIAQRSDIPPEQQVIILGGKPLSPSDPVTVCLGPPGYVMLHVRPSAPSVGEGGPNLGGDRQSAASNPAHRGQSDGLRHRNPTQGQEPAHHAAPPSLRDAAPQENEFSRFYRRYYLPHLQRHGQGAQVLRLGCLVAVVSAALYTATPKVLLLFPVLWWFVAVSDGEPATEHRQHQTDHIQPSTAGSDGEDEDEDEDEEPEWEPRQVNPPPQAHHQLPFQPLRHPLYTFAADGMALLHIEQALPVACIVVVAAVLLWCSGAVQGYNFQEMITSSWHRLQPQQQRGPTGGRTDMWEGVPHVGGLLADEPLEMSDIPNVGGLMSDSEGVDYEPADWESLMPQGVIGGGIF